MPDKPWKLSEITLKDIQDMKQKFEVAVLPFGSTEPHGYHLPHGSDFLEVEGICDACCEYAWEKGAKVVLLPTIPYGMNWNMIKFPMPIHMKATTHLAIVRDVIKSLEAHGIRKLLIVNGHGGNEFKHIIREVDAETDMFVAAANWWQVAPRADKEIFEKREGEHASEMETSMCLALFPELVKMEDAGDGKFYPSRFKAVDDGSVMISRPWHLLTVSSGHGDPSLATADKGRRYLQAIAEKLGQFLVELSTSEMDARFPY